MILHGLLACIVCCAFLAPAHASGPSTGSFEIDLVFPNDTPFSAAGGVVPLVFAVQNYDVAAAANISVIWQLYDNLTTVFYRSSGALTPRNATRVGDGPFFMLGVLDGVLPSTANHTWALNYYTSIGECYTPQNSQSQYELPIQRSHTFTTSDGAPPPDLAAYTAAAACRTAPNLVFDIANYTQHPPGDVDACVTQGSPPTSNGNPCAVGVNATDAASLMQIATLEVCEDAPSAVLRQPSDPSVVLLNCSTVLDAARAATTASSAGRMERALGLTLVVAGLTAMLLL